jgi:hypothetical protein
MRIVSCTRLDAEWQLYELALGWLHLGDAPRATEAFRAFNHLLAGADVVTAGHTQFRIQEASAA